MTLLPCRGCASSVSVEARTCPNCGAPRPTASSAAPRFPLFLRKPPKYLLPALLFLCLLTFSAGAKASSDATTERRAADSRSAVPFLDAYDSDADEPLCESGGCGAESSSEADALQARSNLLFVGAGGVAAVAGFVAYWKRRHRRS